MAARQGAVMNEPSAEESASRIRAGALGAIDGITSVAGVAIGVAAAHPARSELLLAGISALIGGALSMGAGEYASVSAGRDAELADGLPAAQLPSPWAAAFASAIAFTVGAIVPVLAVLLPPAQWRIWAAFVAVILALAAAGVISAKLGGVHVRRAVVRTLLGGGIAMCATYVFGALAA